MFKNALRFAAKSKSSYAKHLAMNSLAKSKTSFILEQETESTLDYYLPSTSAVKKRLVYPIYHCTLIRFTSEAAVCDVIIKNSIVRNVAMPKQVIERKDIKLNQSFLWTVRPSGIIDERDIDSSLPISGASTDADRSKLNTLYESYKKLLEKNKAEKVK